jgi:CHASE3 domain sensor protein
MKPKPLLNRKAQLAFAAAILTMLAVGTISYPGLVVPGLGYQSVRHTHDVLENLQRLLSAMLHVESGFRGMIVTGILERLGGRIWVESQLQKGSTFYFALSESGTGWNRLE